MKANILAEYENYSSPADEDWYEEAHQWASDLGDVFGYSTSQVAGVCAALSANKGWTANMNLTERALLDGKASGTFGHTIAKADAILNGADPLTVLKGHKTVAFYDNILYPDLGYVVTIDRHALSVAMGYKIDDKFQKKLINFKFYEEVADAYREAAWELEMIPSELQAATWCSWRERYGNRKFSTAN